MLYTYTHPKGWALRIDIGHPELTPPLFVLCCWWGKGALSMMSLAPMLHAALQAGGIVRLVLYQKTTPSTMYNDSPFSNTECKVNQSCSTYLASNAGCHSSAILSTVPGWCTISTCHLVGMSRPGVTNCPPSTASP